MINLTEISKLITEQRKSLGFEQKDMYMRIGMKQQQYQRIEAGSDVRLSTLLRVLEGLDLDISITPKQHNKRIDSSSNSLHEGSIESHDSDLLDDDEDDLSFWFKTGDEKQ